MGEWRTVSGYRTPQVGDAVRFYVPNLDHPSHWDDGPAPPEDDPRWDLPEWHQVVEKVATFTHSGIKRVGDGVIRTDTGREVSSRDVETPIG